MDRKNYRGFTLIELSIVLVIIGLIVGGVLVGRDLIASATVRAQISQVERYNAAVNTFRVKYNYLPGDLPDPDATRFGFTARGTLQGQGDGNGMMEGIITYASPYPIGMVPNGENLVFWVDLSKAGLMDGNFTSVNSTTLAASGGTSTPTHSIYPLRLYVPAAVLGQGNYFSIYSDNGVNYYGLQATVSIGTYASYGNPGITVSQAYNIDKKMDDGIPGSGKVIAEYQNGFQCGGLPACGHSFATGALAASAATCFDNDNISGTRKYSINQNNGNGVNCGLSFKFQ